jgi:hypothetical protein
LQVGLTIAATVRKGHYVVNTIGLGYRTTTQTFLTQPLVTLEDPRLYYIPSTTITTLVAT